MSDLVQRLRDAVQKLRRTPMPIADVAPLLTGSADRIEQLEQECSGYAHTIAYSMVTREQYDALERSNKELREALEWYADSANWKRMVAGNGNRSWSRSPAMIDKGARGKFILTQLAALSAADANKGKENG